MYHYNNVTHVKFDQAGFMKLKLNVYQYNMAIQISSVGHELLSLVQFKTVKSAVRK